MQFYTMFRMSHFFLPFLIILKSEIKFCVFFNQLTLQITRSWDLWCSLIGVMKKTRGSNPSRGKIRHWYMASVQVFGRWKIVISIIFEIFSLLLLRLIWGDPSVTPGSDLNSHTCTEKKGRTCGIFDLSVSIELGVHLILTYVEKWPGSNLKSEQFFCALCYQTHAHREKGRGSHFICTVNVFCQVCWQWILIHETCTLAQLNSRLELFFSFSLFEQFYFAVTFRAKQPTWTP